MVQALVFASISPVYRDFSAGRFEVRLEIAFGEC
jgi:hypothetical protein